MHLHVAKAKSRVVTHEAAQKYDGINIEITVIYFENFFSTLISQRVLYLIKHLSMHLRNELYGVVFNSI